MYRGRRRGSVNPWAVYLALQSAFRIFGMPRKPPVTLLLMALNVAIFFRLGPFPWLLPYSIHHVCLNPYTVVQNLDIRRLLLSGFYHVDELHLMYNMSSLLWKGSQLETNLGSVQFGGMVAILLALSHGLLVTTSGLLATFTNWTQPYYDECAVGFSAVLFAMKTILNASQMSSSYTYFQGLLIPTRYASWAELLLIQLALPQSSFFGHLCGILAGSLYLKMPAIWPVVLSYSRRTAPRVRSLAHSLFQKYWRMICGIWGGLPRVRGGYRLHRGQEDRNLERWNCHMCTFENMPSSTACEMCETPKHQGGGGRMAASGEEENASPSAPPLALMHLQSWDQTGVPSASTSRRQENMDEMRRRWTSRFNQSS